MDNDQYLFHADRIQRARDSLKRLNEARAAVIEDESLSENACDHLLRIIHSRTSHTIDSLLVI